MKGLQDGGEARRKASAFGLCTCLYLCGAESKDFSGMRHSKDIPVGKSWVRSEKPPSAAVEGAGELCLF